MGWVIRHNADGEAFYFNEESGDMKSPSEMSDGPQWGLAIDESGKLIEENPKTQQKRVPASHVDPRVPPNKNWDMETTSKGDSVYTKKEGMDWRFPTEMAQDSTSERASVDATNTTNPMLDGKSAVNQLYGPGGSYTDARTTTRSFDPATGRVSLLNQRTGEVQTIGEGGLTGGPKLNLDPTNATAMVPQNASERAIGVQKANQAKQAELSTAQRANPPSVLPQADGSQPNSEQEIKELNKQGMKLKMSQNVIPHGTIAKMEDLASQFEAGSFDVAQKKAALEVKKRETQLWEANRQIFEMDQDAKLAQKAQAIESGFVNENIALKQRYDMRSKNAVKDYTQAYQTFSKLSVDPNKHWNDMGTGGKVAATLSLALGAFSSSLSGAPNFALQILEDAIDRDMSAQRDNIDKAGQAVSMQAERYQMIQQSYPIEAEQLAVIKASSWEAVKNQALAAKASYGVAGGAGDPNSAINQLINNIEIKIKENEIMFQDSFNKSELDSFQLQSDIAKAKRDRAMFELQLSDMEQRKMAAGVTETVAVAARDPEAKYFGMVPRIGPDGKPMAVDKDQLKAARELLNNRGDLEDITHDFMMSLVNRDNPAYSKALRDQARMGLVRALTENPGTMDKGLVDFMEKVGGKDWMSIDLIKTIPDDEVMNLHKLVESAGTRMVGRTASTSMNFSVEQENYWRDRRKAYMKNLEVFGGQGKGKKVTSAPAQPTGSPFQGGMVRYR